MKKLSLIVIMMVLLVSVVAATDTTLDDAELTMDFNDVRVVEFCLSNADGEQNIDVVVDPICKDLNNGYGCGVGDDYAIGSLFTVTPSQNTMNDGDCIELTLETTIANEADAGKFFYTVNGKVGGTTIGSETGTVDVPEFGVIAAMVTLALAGLFIFKRRKD